MLPENIVEKERELARKVIKFHRAVYLHLSQRPSSFENQRKIDFLKYTFAGFFAVIDEDETKTEQLQDHLLHGETLVSFNLFPHQGKQGKVIPCFNSGLGYVCDTFIVHDEAAGSDAHNYLGELDHPYTTSSDYFDADRVIYSFGFLATETSMLRNSVSLRLKSLENITDNNQAKADELLKNLDVNIDKAISEVMYRLKESGRLEQSIKRYKSH